MLKPAFSIGTIHRANCARGFRTPRPSLLHCFLLFLVIMKLAVIVATRNRAYAILGCLQSIQEAIANAAPIDAEIVVVDNGSTDETSAILKKWASTCPTPVQLLSEPKAGLSRARNRALRSTRADLMSFTDDDCRLSKDYISQLLRHDEIDTDLVLRTGRVELGEPTDLPITINTADTLMRWSLKENSARHHRLSGLISGCNMAMRRALVERLGPFDERLGAGASIPSAEDTDYNFRAYLAGATLEYVPDMTVFHHHGRKTIAAARKLLGDYEIGNGALYARYLFKHPNLCRPFYWTCKDALREIITGTNTFLPDIGFSEVDRVTANLQGAARYLFTRKQARSIW
jgi:glycosyltransferase involved in cell wall biosynthesis